MHSEECIWLAVRVAPNRTGHAGSPVIEAMDILSTQGARSARRQIRSACRGIGMAYRTVTEVIIHRAAATGAKRRACTMIVGNGRTVSRRVTIKTQIRRSC